MSTETQIDALVAAQAVTVKDMRATMSGNAGEAAGNAAAVTALLAGQSFTATNLLGAIFELDSNITSITINDTDGLPEGATNLYYTDARVIASPLTGFVAGTGSVAVTATDTILQAMEKLEGIRARFGTVTLNDMSITDSQILWSSEKVEVELNDITNRASLLTGLATSNVVVTATDTMLSAFGKLQGQVNNIVSTTITDTDGLAEGATNLYFTEPRVLATVLTGFIAGDGNTAVAATDSVLAAIQKLEGVREKFSGISIDDTQADPTLLWSSDKIDTDISDIANRASTLTGLTTSNVAVAATDTIKTAVGKLQGQVSAIDLTDLIDDASTSLTTTWSSTEIDSRIQGVIDTAPAALDTLNELAAALGDDANFSATVTTNLATKANSADIYTKTELGPNFTTKDWAADWATAIS